jgi:HSP20 family molecular chaperone IbpA
MPRIEIKTAEPGGDLAATLRTRIDEVIENVRRRAYELFEQRGHRNGSDLDDWFRAEKEFLFPAKCMVKQEPDRYKVSVSIPGFTGKDLKVYTLGDRLVVSGEVAEKSTGKQSFTEEKRSVFYQCTLPPGSLVNAMTADIEHETLNINIPTEAKPKSVQVVSGEVANEQKRASTAA